MARPQTKVNKEEVDEIINLKLQELGGIKSKLTYNNVWNFNKKLCKENAKRKNGDEFKLYGYTFWASEYNTIPYYGKQKIDEIKSSNNIILAGESFDIQTEDILLTVDKFHKKPEELSRRLIKTFKKDRKRIDSLEKQNKELNDEVRKLRRNLEIFERGFATMFMNSNDINNSLKDVISLNKSGDANILKELNNMFDNDNNRISKILNPSSEINNNDYNNNVINIQDKAIEKLKNIAKLEEEGF